MYKFTVKRGYLTVEDAENNMTAIISCYGLDLHDDYSFTSDDDETVRNFVKNHMKENAEMFAWGESSDPKKWKWGVYYLDEYLDSMGTNYISKDYAQSREHFDSWFVEHERFINAILSGMTLRNDTLMCNDKDKSMWVHRATTIENDTSAWLISQMLPSGKIIASFRTKPASEGCGDWYKCVQHQKEMADLFQKERLNKIGRIPNKFENRSIFGWCTMDE